MSTFRKEFGVVGLGRMGGNLARQALRKGHRVVGFNLEASPADLLQNGMIEIRTLAGFRDRLERPRAILIYIPAGAAIDKAVDELATVLEPGDVVVDGGNSYWGDSIRRQRRLKLRGLNLVDLGTSGGVDGALNGACFMAGGERDAIARVEPILLDLCVQGGYVHAGPPGAGHFTKLVHNGIEFGMLQAIGEGVDLLERYRDRLNIKDILGCWRNGSVVRSWLVDLMHMAYEREGGLENIPGTVEDTGEVNWLVDDALHMETPIPVIAQSIMMLFASRDDRRNWARAVAMMRRGFGGHPYGRNEAVANIRKTSRVGQYLKENEP